MYKFNRYTLAKSILLRLDEIIELTSTYMDEDELKKVPADELKEEQVLDKVPGNCINYEAWANMRKLARILFCADSSSKYYFTIPEFEISEDDFNTIVDKIHNKMEESMYDVSDFENVVKESISTVLKVQLSK